MFRPTKIIDPKTPTNKMNEQESNQNIQVFVRCRPLKSKEKKGLLDIIPDKRSIKTVQQNKTYSFDNVFDANAKQLDVYRSVVEPLVEQVIEGYNCTVFAYGQTGTGKTYTMIGDRTDGSIAWDEDPLSGIIPRAVDQLLEDLSNQVTEYSIRVSFLELYNEDAYDLLSPLSDTNKLRIFHDKDRKGSVVVSNLVEMMVKTKEEIFEVLEKGSLKRQTAPTLMNACSSRSHSIFSITVHIKEITLAGEEVVKMGKLNLVDLAGSENIGRSGAVEERAREASNINKSLLTLGRVITSLVEKSSHIPYRDSKLTRLLQDSLGGKTKTSIIATISPCSDDLEDTISTLEYAQRAKKITNNPEINLKMTKKTLINEYMNEIDRLRRDLEAARDQKGIYVDAKNYQEMQALLKLQEQNLEVDQAKIDVLKQDLEKYSELLSEANENLNIKCRELENLRENLENLTQDLNQTRESLKQAQKDIEDCHVVIDAHVTTEQKLLKKAKTVVDVTERCVNDNQKLLNKVESYASAEEFNIGLLQQMKNQFSERLEKVSEITNMVCRTVSKGQENIEKLVKNDRIDISNRQNQFSENVSNIKGKFDQFEKLFLNGLDQDKNQLAISKSECQQLLENFKKDITEQLSQMEDVLQDSENAKNRIIENLKLDLANARMSLEESILTQVTNIDELIKYVTQTAQIMISDQEKMYATKCQENETLTNDIDMMKTLVQEEMEKEDEKIEKLLQAIEEIKSSRQTMMCSFSDQLSRMKTGTETIMNIDSESHSRSRLKCNELSHKLKKDEKEIRAGLSNIDDQIGRDVNSALAKSDLIKNIDINFKQNYKKFNEYCMNDITTMVASVTSNIDSLSEQLSDASGEKIKIIQNFKVESEEMIDSNCQIINGIVSKADSTFEQTLNEYKAVESDCATWMNVNQNIILDECKTMVRKMLKSTKKCLTTGCTPKKVTYSFPRSFTPTSPHERIIMRSRNGTVDGNEELQMDVNLKLEETDEDNNYTDENVGYDLGITDVKTEPVMGHNSLLKEKNSLS